MSLVDDLKNLQSNLTNLIKDLDYFLDELTVASSRKDLANQPDLRNQVNKILSLTKETPLLVTNLIAFNYGHTEENIFESSFDLIETYLKILTKKLDYFEQAEIIDEFEKIEQSSENITMAQQLLKQPHKNSSNDFLPLHIAESFIRPLSPKLAVRIAKLTKILQANAKPYHKSIYTKIASQTPITLAELSDICPECAATLPKSISKLSINASVFKVWILFVRS